MAERKTCFEEHGFEIVVTYIQSRNVLFESGDSASAILAQRLEDMLAATFSYRASVVRRTRKQPIRTAASSRESSIGRIARTSAKP